MAQENNNAGLLALVIVLVGVIIVGAMYFMDMGQNDTTDINVDIPDLESQSSGN